MTIILPSWYLTAVWVSVTVLSLIALALFALAYFQEVRKSKRNH